MDAEMSGEKYDGMEYLHSYIICSHKIIIDTVILYQRKRATPIQQRITCDIISDVTNEYSGPSDMRYQKEHCTISMTFSTNTPTLNIIIKTNPNCGTVYKIAALNSSKVQGYKTLKDVEEFFRIRGDEGDPTNNVLLE